MCLTGEFVEMAHVRRSAQGRAMPQAGAGDVNGGRINGTDSRRECWCEWWWWSVVGTWARKRIARSQMEQKVSDRRRDRWVARAVDPESTQRPCFMLFPLWAFDRHY
jgi:hypothetical protein